MRRLLILFFWGCCQFSVFCQSNIDKKLLLTFEKADMYVNSFRQDSAIILLTYIAEQLSSKKQLYTQFGLKVLQQKAAMLERADKNEEAIQSLLQVIESCHVQQKWDVLAKSYLSMALLHEKLLRWDSCYANLEKARSIIHSEKLDSITPFFANRMASYHRLHGEIDSAIYYANLAISSGIQHTIEAETGLGHLLLGMLLSTSSYSEAVFHFEKAAWYWKKINDYHGLTATLSNLSNLHLKNGNIALALQYNDSSFSILKGHENLVLEWIINNQRAAIFEKTGQLDSALFFTKQGYNIRFEYEAKANKAKVAEIEAQYNDEKKTRLIVEQNQKLQQGRNRQYWLWGGICSIALLTALLLFFYLRLSNAKRKTEAQAVLITEQNQQLSNSLQQQKILLGEVHHRVKNNLQIIISLLELHAEELDNEEAGKSFQSLSQRIYSMAAIHELMYGDEGVGTVDLATYIQTLCHHIHHTSFSEDPPIVELDLPNIQFNLATLIPLGIILNELFTNSFKYAYSLENRLMLTIKLSHKDAEFHLYYKDNGPGIPNGQIASKTGSLGHYLLSSMARQLRGTFKSYNDAGAVFELRFKNKNN